MVFDVITQIQAFPIPLIWQGGTVTPPSQTGIESEAGTILETESGTAIQPES